MHDTEEIEDMVTKKQQLIDNPETYSNDDHEMDLWFSETLNEFCIRFSGKLHTYKSWSGFVAKRNYFIEKYSLEKQ